MVQTEEPRDYNSYLGKELSELIILSALSPAIGYSAYKIIKTIKEATNGKISFRAGTIYPQMEKLEKRGLLLRHVEDTSSRYEGVRRQKSIYLLTAEGVNHLNQKRREWEILQQTINKLLQNKLGGSRNE